jgi:glycosyltransferase involved in cell wall biosynthesis
MTGHAPGKEVVIRARRTPAWERAYSNEPLVSVRIATRNRAELLVKRALASVRRQTYERWEAVIVGSACSDDTEARVAALGDPRIRFRNLPTDGPYPEGKMQGWLVGGVPSMNAALEMASGSWIAPLDDDDEWDDDHLEILLRAAQSEGAGFAYGRLRCRLNGAPVRRQIGAWPPRQGQVSLGAAIYNAALRDFRHDLQAGLLGEPHDWNLIRRMWEAGVAFTFVDRTVATYHMDHARAVLSGTQPAVPDPRW